jgi:hypothetical protein
LLSSAQIAVLPPSLGSASRLLGLSPSGLRWLSETRATYLFLTAFVGGCGRLKLPQVWLDLTLSLAVEAGKVSSPASRTKSLNARTALAKFCLYFSGHLGHFLV